MQLSYWENETFFKDVDVTVVGSGIVGLNAAIELKSQEPRLKILVLDRGSLPYGASTRNAGFACFGSISELLDDLGKESEVEVFERVEKRFRGLQKLRQKLGDTNIQYEEKGGYEIFTEKDSATFEKCIDKINYFNQQLKSITASGQTYELRNDLLPQFGFDGVRQLIKNNFEGQLDTGKMMLALLRKAQQLDIFLLNGISVDAFEDDGSLVEIITSQDFSFTTKKLLVCNNGFAKQLLPELQVEPARAQVLITSPLERLPFQGCFHYDRGYYYFRDVGDRVLFGGGRNLNFEGEHTAEFGLTDQIQNHLDQLLRDMILPGQKFSVEQRWSGIMGLGPKKSTIIKNISTNVVCAVRMGGMGVAIGTLVGEEAAALVLHSG
jgi:glycine/D-amino acid oxidase-like deaminating enzyme